MTSKMATATKISSVFRPKLFRGKVAIVTGGGTGIGKAIAQELLHLGCKVMIASRNLERLSASAKEMKSEISNSSAELEHMQCNIRKEDQVKELISNTLSRFGQLDYLVNNGGGQFPSPASQIRLKGWNAVIETNLTGTFLCCREAHNQWMEEHGGVIVNIIADMWRGFPALKGLTPADLTVPMTDFPLAFELYKYPDQSLCSNAASDQVIEHLSHTGAARAGVDNLTKSMAIEWAHNGIRINSVAPGSSIYSDTAASSYGDPTIFNSTLPNIPAKRFGSVEEVSAAVCFLLSPAASFISGETLKVDAGGSLYKSNWNIPEHDKSPAYRWSEDKVEDGEDGSKSKL